MKSLSLNVSYLKFCVVFAKKLQIEFAFLVFFTLLMLVVTEIGTSSFEGNISLIQFQNLGLFLFSNNKSFSYFCLACLALLLHKFLNLL